MPDNDVNGMLRAKRAQLTKDANKIRAELAPVEARWGELRNGAAEATPGEREAVKAKLRELREKLFPVLADEGKTAKALPEGRSMSESRT